MPTSRSVVRTARLVTVYLVAVLVCPAVGEVAAFPSNNAVACSSAHACCRRADMNGGCPHRSEMTEHDHHCHAAVCVLTCADHRAAAVVPLLLIGFSLASGTCGPQVAVSASPVDASGAIRPLVGAPLTPPPRSLPAL